MAHTVLLLILKTDVSLAQSHSYSLSASGYGKVALFTSDVRDYYDGMNGVDISV